MTAVPSIHFWIWASQWGNLAGLSPVCPTCARSVCFNERVSDFDQVGFRNR